MSSHNVPQAHAADHDGSAPPADVLALARDVLTIEAQAILTLSERIDASFEAAVQMLLACSGRVVVSGIGKSGHIARKIAATFASTGTPAFFVHPAEASHGDLGMVTKDDVFVALSNSGETAELLTILPVLKRQGAHLIAITGNAQSSLAKLADIHLDAHVDKEACPLNLAPTASTTAALALGDALAVVLLDLRGFNTDDYARSHPGGALGRRLLTRVRDVMRSGSDVPIVSEEASLLDALAEISKKGLAMTAVTNAHGEVVGIFTDGDLRRLLGSETADIKGLLIGQVMRPKPHFIGADRLAAQAAELMEHHRVNQLLVDDGHGVLVGAIHIHDLTNAKVI